MDLRTILTPLLRWWWLLLAATAVAAGSSYVAVSQQPPTYWSGTTLMIGSSIDDPNPSGSELYLSQQLAATYVDVARRQPVRQKTMDALGINWLPSYNVRQIPNSQLLEISVVDTNPVRAQLVVNELANQLILQSPTAPRPEEQEREAFIDEQLSNLQIKIKETEDEITVKQADLENAISAREISDLEDEIRTLQSKLATLQGNFGALLSNTQGGAVNTLTVIEPAGLPTTPIGPNKKMTVLTAASVGFALAAAAALLLEYLDDRIKSVADLEPVTGLTVLPPIPKFNSDDKHIIPIVHTNPRSPAADAFRALRTNLLASDEHGYHRTHLVTSVKPRDGKSSVAANLAVVLAQGGHNVLILDADLRRPVQHTIFDRKKGPGLADLLLFFGLASRVNDVDSLLYDLIQPTQEPRLDLLSSGDLTPETLKLLNSEIVAKVLDALSSRYDYLIIDSPPILAVNDAIMLASHVDNVLLVGETGTVRRKELVNSLERLRSVEAHVAGITLNRISPKADNYYYNRYQAYYDKFEDTLEPGGEYSSNGTESEFLRKWIARATAGEKN